MAKIFCVANQKGGVGKTTTAVNLAASLAALDQRVLLVDLDPQGNATMGSGIDKAALRQHRSTKCWWTASRCATRASAPKPSTTTCCRPNRELAGAEVEMVELDKSRARAARWRWPQSIDDYDFVLIDCPPALSMLTLNGLCSAHGVIIPMQCEYFALEGLSDLVNTIKQVHANLNRDLKMIGLLRVMFDPRITLSQQVSRPARRSTSATKCSKMVDPAQRAPCGSAELRHAGRRVRPVVDAARRRISRSARKWWSAMRAL